MTNYSHYRDKIESAYSSQKSAVYGIATASAVAAMVPVPGLDIALDIASLIAFANTSIDEFGLSEKELEKAYRHITAIAVDKCCDKAEDAAKEMAIKKAKDVARKRVYKYLEKAGILALVKKFAVQKAGGAIAKFIPFVGSVVSGSIAFFCAQDSLNEMLEDMYSTAKEIYL